MLLNEQKQTFLQVNLCVNIVTKVNIIQNELTLINQDSSGTLFHTRTMDL